jgi:hypothetical protein
MLRDYTSQPAVLVSMVRTSSLRADARFRRLHNAAIAVFDAAWVRSI